jgi:hypothetical protein
MSKKPDKITQVRISPQLAKRITALRDKCEFKVSFPAYVETLITRGINATFQTSGPQRISDLADNADSTFKK